MDVERVHALRDALRHTEWWSRATLLGSALRATSGPGHLLLVGTPRVEPWHLAAHLDDEARLSELPQLSPALVRWSPPPQAPPHLSIGLSRLEHAGRGETVFVVSPDSAPDPLLNRVDDARRTGATIVALDAEEGPLAALAHERMTVSPSGLSLPDALRNVLTPLTQVGTNRGRPPHTALGSGIDPAGASAVGPAGDPALDPADPTAALPAHVAAGLALPASFELAQHFVSAAAGMPAEHGRRGWRTRLGSLLDAISGPRPSSPGG
jgi:hypothetical protein